MNKLKEKLSYFVLGRGEEAPLKTMTIIWRMIVLIVIYVSFALNLLLFEHYLKSTPKEEQYKAKIIELEKVIKQYQIN